MKPETLDFLAAADLALSKAHRILSIDISDEAARHAYYAQFHAAQALIFERVAKISKTHKGVNGEFHKLAKIEVGLPLNLGAQLSKAYRYKEVADYGIGIASPISTMHARDAVSVAECFVASIRRVLTP
jgi:uncharacterized protein (UPF0332 family)